MKDIKNFLIKREQSQARLSFAKREKSRLLAKTILTLVLLLTVATGAWAESKPIGLNVEYAAGDEITSTTDVYVYYGDEPGTLKKMGVKITSTQPLTISMIIPDHIKLNGDVAVYYLPSGESTGGYGGGISCVGESTGDATVVHVASGSGTLADPYVFGSGPSGTPVDLTRGTGEKINEWTLTNGMPAGNVTVSVEYFPQAEFAMSTGETPVALAPAPIPGVPANTDDPIVTAGTVANIGTTDDKQGTLMYFVSQSTGNTVPDAPDYDTKGWSDKVPTANGLKQGDVYVWYYIKGAEPANIADRTDDNTRSDSDIKPLGTTGFVTLLPEPTYDVTLNDEGLSTDEAAAWKVAKGTDQPAAFPLEGVKKGETVTVTYTGSKKVIGVKAEKKGGATDNTYQKWDANQKKLVATDIPAEVTTAENADEDVFWAAGTYVVEGNVTISGQITLNGNVDLIIKDGAKLTVNMIYGNTKNLSIFGQTSQTGQLVVNCDVTDAFNDITTLEFHSANVTATSSQYNCGGFYRISTFNVYGGSVDAENTGGSGYGIGLNENGSMNIYGGEVKAVGDGTGNAYPFGIRSSDDGATVTVYGGTLWAENADNAALRNTITLQKGAGFSGKIETSDNGTSWTEYTEAGTPGTKYVRVGY